MIRVDIKDLDLENDELIKDETYILTLNGKDKYILTSYEYFEDVKESMTSYKPQGVKVLAEGDIDINEVEYEEIKQQLLDALDEALKPNVKKLS